MRARLLREGSRLVRPGRGCLAPAGKGASTSPEARTTWAILPSRATRDATGSRPMELDVIRRAVPCDVFPERRRKTQNPVAWTVCGGE